MLIVGLLLGLVPLVADAQAPVTSQPSISSTTADSIDRRIAPTGLSSLHEQARSSISAAMGRDLRGYQAHAQGAGFQAENARHKLVVDFTSEGVAMHTESALWRLALRGFGYGNALKEVDAAFPKASFNRVEYQHGSLTEWYVNGPLGLEQGLTVNEPPGQADGQPLTIALAISGDLMAAVDRGRTGLTLTARDQQAELHYSGLVAFDATGMPLRAWLELQGGRLLVRVAETGAQYPIVIDPWVQLAKLTASDGRNWDELGWSVAVSGNTVVVGVPGLTIGSEGTGDEAGAVYVFVKPPTGWANMTQIAKLWASDYKVDDDLGTSVAISGDTVVSGAPHNIEGPWAPGAAYVFVKPANGWTNMTETAKLTPSDGFVMDFFGSSVSISGNTVVVGAPTGSPYSLRGAAYVFVKPQTGWASMTQTAKLTNTARESATGLGRGVSIGGNTVVAGTTSYLSTTYVFVKPPTGWANMTQTAKLTSSDYYKYPVNSVAIDGNTVVAGTSAAVVGGHQQVQGEAYVFVSPPTGWADMTQTAVLTASDGAAGDNLGFSASIAGNTVVLGAPFADIGGNTDEGAAYVFVKPANGWANMTETAKVTEAEGAANDKFGWSVFINGGMAIGISPVVVVVGAVETTAFAGAGHGAAYIFSNLR
jgi:hypothetical protein